MRFRAIPANPGQGHARPCDLALRRGLAGCCGRGFACYVWDPVTAAGAAGRGSAQAPAAFRGQCGLAALAVTRSARPGLPGSLCASARPGRGCL
jgi:hypothetical protein